LAGEIFSSAPSQLAGEADEGLDALAVLQWPQVFSSSVLNVVQLEQFHIFDSRSINILAKTLAGV
jgi:hypothetical protein